MSWTEERVAILKKLWSEGLSASQIAAEMGGVSRNAVIGKVHRLKLPGRTKTAPATTPVNTVKTPRAPRVSFASKATATPEEFSPVKEAISFTTPPIAKKAPPEVAVVELEPLQERRLTLLELTESTCKWPTGDPLAEDFYFCGADSQEGSPYCKHHSKIAFQAISERRRKAL